MISDNSKYIPYQIIYTESREAFLLCKIIFDIFYLHCQPLNKHGYVAFGIVFQIKAPLLSAVHYIGKRHPIFCFPVGKNPNRVSYLQ